MPVMFHVEQKNQKKGTLICRMKPPGITIMAKVQFTAIVDGIRGKLRGSVFARNKAGAYIRGKGTVNNPQYPAQQAVRAAFGLLSQAYKALSESNVMAWINLAAEFPRTDVFGNQYTLTGLQMYNSVNTNRQMVGLAAIDAPVNTEAPDVSAQSSVAIDVSEEEIVVETDEVISAADYLVIEATPSYTPSKRNVKNKFRQIATEAGAGTSITTNVWAAYISKFGVPITGHIVTVKVYLVRGASGFASVPFTIEALVVA